MKNITSAISGKSLTLLGLTAIAILGLSSCLPLAAGAAGGYMARDAGYTVRNPIEKEE